MDSYTSSSADMSGGIIAVLLGILLIPMIVMGLIQIISMWKIFTKAGKPGWASIIPIYSTIVWLEIIGKPMWWLIMFLIPCTIPIFAIWALNLLVKSFGKSEGFTVGCIFLPFIFFPILAFGSATYLGPSAKEAQGNIPFDPNNYRDPFNNQNPPPQNY